MKRNRLLLAILIISVMGLGSCVSSPKTEPEKEKTTEAKAEKPPVVKVAGTIDFSAYEGGALWNTLPDGNPLFFAAVSRMGDRDMEEEECLNRAAVQASKFIAVQAKAKFISQKSNTGVGYASDIEINYDTELAVSLKEDLSVEKTYQDNEGTYVIARLGSTQMGSIPYKVSSQGGKPAWVENPPAISGYYTAVGVAQRSRFFADSVAAADDMALEDLVKQISIGIKSARSDISVDRVGTATDQINYEEAEATVSGFYVIARWRTNDGSFHYSLAVAPKK
jgi:hypothetical protein